MPVSKAQKEASSRYDKQNMRRVTVVFSPNERDIQEYLESKGSMSGYLKQLLREDYDRHQRESE